MRWLWEPQTRLEEGLVELGSLIGGYKTLVTIVTNYINIILIIYINYINNYYINIH